MESVYALSNAGVAWSPITLAIAAAVK